jgi:hypothetical protein
MVVNVDAPTEVKPPYFAPLGRRTGGVPEFLGFSLDFHSVNISGSGVGSGSVSVFLAMWTRSLVSTSRSKPTAFQAVSFQQVSPLLPRAVPGAHLLDFW